jgi:aryl-alcohol dehydrogenase-like predicted oxidoreductase
VDFRILGKTGLKTSVLSFGCSSLGGVFRDVEDAEAIRTVHTALDLGINFIDVSPFYGMTRAETVLGKALRGVPRDDYYLATKVGRYGETEFDFSADRVTASVDESLRRLEIDTIDLIQCHDIEYGDLDQVIHETMLALRRLQEKGKVRFVGITGFPLNIFNHVLDRTEVDTILTYCHYSLNNTTLGKLIPKLEHKQIGIINASPLSMGLLTNRGTPGWHPATEEIKTVCGKAAAYCHERGNDIAQLALQFSLANPRIHTTLIGTANPENLQKSVKWLESAVDEELLAKVQKILEPIRDKTWVIPGQVYTDLEEPLGSIL